MSDPGMSDPGMTWQERYGAGLMNTYGTPPLLLTRGEGSHVWDADGKEYVDLLAGIAVNSLGHAHPAVISAVSEQVSTLGHISNLFASEPQIALAQRLLALLGSEGRVFFSNSGTEANEAAFKLTRRTGRTHIVATDDAFHGRTMGALALTANEAYRTPFEPLPGDVTWVPFGDAEALAAAVTDETAAVVLEPLQGEAGVNQPGRDYLAAARAVADEHGALLWLDEIQTGVGRTGTWFAHQNPALFDGHVVPDIVTLAKGLGGGMPIGATIALGAAAGLLQPGNHGTTFGGNPMSTAAALAVLDTIESDGLLEHVTQIGSLLRDGLTADARVTEVRGAGLLIGLDLADGIDTKAVAAAAMAAGWIINAPRPQRIRLAPPLVLTRVDAEEFVAAWPGLLDSVESA